jgi:hypothetical protein
MTAFDQRAETRLRDASYWAPPVSRLKVVDVPSSAVNLNVDGRRIVGPLQGFGQMWQKTYRVRLTGIKVTPAQVVQTWKENFTKFQPPENRFYPSPAGITPGEVVLINAMTPGGPVATAIMALYANDESFTLITPEGHPESGWVMFSAFEQDGTVTAQMQSLARARGPIYEQAYRPVARLVPYSTPTEGIYICSSSTPPGGGVHGMCGYYAARAVLNNAY